MSIELSQLQAIVDQYTSISVFIVTIIIVFVLYDELKNTILPNPLKWFMLGVGTTLAGTLSIVINVYNVLKNIN